jgi:hypothetical protein
MSIMTMKSNPYTPSAGHPPKYLAGRQYEIDQFKELLNQEVVMENLVLTGLRGIGKTVLLNNLKPHAAAAGWAWVGEDCSEQVSISEESIATRLLTDLALLTSGVYVNSPKTQLGFNSATQEQRTYLTYDYLRNYYDQAPGLVADKLKRVFEHVWSILKTLDGLKGIVFAYDEAQNLSDQSQDKQYPLSLLLDVFQYLQRNSIPFMLILTGLPTLMTTLVEARTYSERLFRVQVLTRLTDEASIEAITRPLNNQSEIAGFDDKTVEAIVAASGGYPYFIQFICKEAYDVFVQQKINGTSMVLPMDTIMQKLDNSFFLARWQRATERERELLFIIANYAEEEFGLNEVSDLTEKHGEKRIAPSQILRHFKKLTSDGLIYKTRRGNYSFAVPLLERFIKRNFNK